MDDLTSLVDPALLPAAAMVAGVVEIVVKAGLVPRAAGGVVALIIGIVAAALFVVGEGGGVADVVVGGFFSGIAIGLIASGMYSTVKTAGELSTSPAAEGSAKVVITPPALRHSAWDNPGEWPQEDGADGQL